MARPRVYVSGPMSTSGDIAQNVAFGCNAFRALVEAGFAPLCPHLSYYAEKYHYCQWDHETWLAIDLEWVEQAEAVYRLKGPSVGADMECDHAKRHGIPVFYSVAELETWRDHDWRRGPVRVTPLAVSAVAPPASKHTHGSRDVEYASGAVRSGEAEGACFHLVTPVGLRRVAEACHEGATKYAPYNWEKGMPVKDLLEHALQHIYHYLDGDRTEDHLGHAGWNILGACHSEERWPEVNKGTLRPVRTGNSIRNPNELKHPGT